jgi:hypothetical protein
MPQHRFSRRVFFALLAAILWAGFVVDGSHALFADQVTLTGNSIVSGTANLLLSNSQNPSSTVFDKSRAGFALNLSPGQDGEKYFLLKNSSDGDIDFKVSLSAVLTEDPSHDLSMHTRLVFNEIGADGLPTEVATTATLYSLSTSAQETPFIVPKGTTKRYLVTTHLDEAYQTQGQSLTYDLILIGTQYLAS